ncbi:28S ribosomal protein S5, mitochondrial isoform X2 [Diachasma alloeum]|uniref:28S ribosomal protein S5, mitochondrial isoform X2 n=1 Tax=Diachasma alloeum TaxID=454923 RepID=UPI0007382EC1|nr:28S ribosomal protein S5, mitochondrial isoform X2 [Diachasma alloeum]
MIMEITHQGFRRLQRGLPGSQCALETINEASPVKSFVRNVSFFNEYPADHLWKSATHVSNAGRKRGRAKSRRIIKNLNKGQVIGVGKKNMLWPGLNAPVMRGRELVNQQKLPDNPEYEKKIFAARDAIIKKRRVKLSPLERGWSGAKPGGRSIGPPDPIGEENFEGFDTRILEYKLVSVMTGNMGRKRRVSAMVITGNGNGLAGFAMGKAPEGRPALKMAKNRAAMKLIYINRHNEHTVFHDFFCQFGKTKIFVSKKAEGYGLRCHRAIKTCCEMIGIKDLYAKVEGSLRLQHIIKAFFVGLLQQKTHEQLAEEKQLHVVELREENGNFPVVVASPAIVRKPEEISSTEVMDFSQYVMGGKVVYRKKKYPPFYTRLPSWTIRLRKTAYLRNKEDVRIRLYAEHGELRSFMTDKYPEAKPTLWSEVRKQRAMAAQSEE